MNESQQFASLLEITEPQNSAESLETLGSATMVPQLPEVSPQDDDRQGATATSWTESDPNDLPMIVWLRGDETWYPSFDLDADGVMARLGIKRSRLTQISGRELRVGRVRVDRYIKPIYRSEDVETYAQWTRATASHQKSSSVIKEAAEQLQQQSNHISQIVTEASQHFAKALEDGLIVQLESATTRASVQLGQTVQRLYAESAQAIQSHNDERRSSQTTLDALSGERHGEVTKHLIAIDRRLAHHDASLESMALRLSELAMRIGTLIEVQEHQQSMILKISEVVMAQQAAMGRLVNEGDWWSRRKVSRRQKKQTPLQAEVVLGPSKNSHRPTRRRVQKI